MPLPESRIAPFAFRGTVILAGRVHLGGILLKCWGYDEHTITLIPGDGIGRGIQRGQTNIECGGRRDSLGGDGSAGGNGEARD